MNKEILAVVDVVSNEKGVEKEVIFGAIEAALAAAAAKNHEEDIEARVAIDRTTGEYETFRRWLVFADESTELEFPDHELRMIDAVDVDKDAEPGGYVEVPMESTAFGRISAQMAKQVIVQKVREAEREKVVDAYQDREGELLSGLVKRVDRNGVYMDLGGNAEGFISRDNMMPREAVRVHDRIKALLTEVRSEPRGPQLFMTRTSPQFLIELFKIEVPEVGQGLIEILGAARDPGLRAKISVKSNESRIDPVGACVGMRGSRVQSVSNELAGERVDIILWNDNPAQYVINSMSPAEVASIIVDEDSNTMDIAVEEDNLAQAIGRNGQNVRLSSELTGWTINVMSEEEASEKQQQEASSFIDMFVEKLDVDEESAEVLVQEGFTSLEEIAYVPLDEILAIDGFDEEIANELRNRAKDALLTLAIASEEDLSAANIADDLLNMEGMDGKLALELAKKGILNMEELAEQSIDELIDIESMDEERAGQLIMTARAPWFE